MSNDFQPFSGDTQAEKAKSAAIAYVEMGWNPMPIAIRTKGIPVKGWQDLRVTAETVGDYFGDNPRTTDFYYGKEPGNVGVLLGHASGGLVDIDLDCPEAVKLASAFLPRTGAVFGRKSAGWSHRIYYCRGIESWKVIDPTPGKKDAIAEIRANKKDGTAGFQTVLPPSIHEGTGEEIKWFNNRFEPSEVEPVELKSAFEKLCAASILVKFWTEGSRHDLALSLAGALSKNTDWTEDEVADFVQNVVEAADCGQIEKKVTAARVTHQKAKAGQEVTGLLALEEILGKEVTKKISELLGLKRKRGRPAKEHAPVPAEVVDRYAYVSSIDRFVNLQTYAMRTMQSIDRKYAHELGDKAGQQLVLDPNFRKFEELTYMPGADIAVNDPMQEGNDLSLNMWRERPIVPRKGSTGLFYDHLEYMIPDDQIRNHILDFIAHIIQYPGKKINHVVLIQGKQGLGKSYLMSLLKAILGRHNVNEVSPEAIRSEFTEWIERYELVVFEEIMGLGKREFTNKIKPKVTSDTLNINRKGVSAYDIPNRVNFLAFTNYKDALALDDDDRRFMVYFSEAEVLEPSYYDKLFQEIPDIAEAVYHSLLVRDILDFNPAAPPPMTQSKREMISDSASPLEQDMRDAIIHEDYPFNGQLVLMKAVREWALERKYRNNETTPAKITAMLKHLGAQRMPHQVTSGPYKGQHPWVLRPTEQRNANNLDPTTLAAILEDAEKNTHKQEPV